jgi:hypothetical protein
MTPEAQRIAIAEACGWAYDSDEDDWDIHSWLASAPLFDTAGKLYGRLVDQPIPDYLSDLNAMHEAEEVLTREQCELYVIWLYSIAARVEFEQVRHRLDLQLTPWMISFLVLATAAQRAEAFLRTLGLWKD